ncbi:Rack1 [Symbiodinium natans]|uniref:Rack1 protein n=1 Tax=Symbiodinium natans TaxID=878477 RepID=A0A812SN30_9DINO|nr:Rack1 [Symbiodinium natans]
MVYEGRLDGHRGGVTALSFSEDGKRLLTASEDRTLRLWERSEDEGGEGFGGPSKAFALKRTLRHSDVVSAAVLEKGGDFALSCSWDRTVKLWKLDEEDEDPCLRTMRGHKHQVNAVVWSPDVRVIVTASCDKQLKIWNNLGECKFSLQYNDGHEDWVSAVAYGDECLLSAGWDRTVKLWNTKNFSMEWEMKNHTAPVHAVAIAPDSRHAASGGADRTVLVSDLKEKKVIGACEVDGTIRSLDFHPTEAWLAAMVELPTGGAIWVLDVMARTSVARLVAPSGANACRGLAVKWDPKGTRVFGGFSDGSVQVWRTPSPAAAPSRR